MSTERSTGKQHIPIVDMGRLGVGVEGVVEEREVQRVAKELGAALGGVGFVYLDNHGIPKEQIDAVFLSSAKFFTLNSEVKKKYETFAEENQQGYITMGRETLYLGEEEKTLELRESYNMKNKDGLFPDEEVPEMRRSLSAFQVSCKTLTSRLLTSLALALDLERDFFTSVHKKMFTARENMTTVRSHYYPTVPPSTTLCNAIRCGAHTDYGTITLLFQDQMGGLQVMDVGGSWVDAEPIPGTIVVNAGDLLQYWTAGKFVATKHRVIIPEEELRRKVPRQSVAAFIHPDDETLIVPLDGSQAYNPVNAREHVIHKFSKTFGYIWNFKTKGTCHNPIDIHKGTVQSLCISN